jgi:hypothetical protein
MIDNIDYVYISIFVVLTVLVVLNSYNVYRLNKKNDYLTIVDLKEFEKLHPIIKELYVNAIVEGAFPYAFEQLNKFIKINNIDKWYYENENEINKLIETYKKVLNSQSFKNMSSNEFEKILKDNFESNITIAREIESNIKDVTDIEISEYYDKEYYMNTIIFSKIFNSDVKGLNDNIKKSFL